MTERLTPNERWAELDPRLREFVEATSAADADRHLARLLEEEAAPVIARVLQRNGTDRNDFDDLTSATRLELIPRLLALRESSAAAPIRNFRGYVGAVTYSVWALQLRNEHPGRAKLLNRLRYLLENRTTQRGFALWTNDAGEQWAGFARWRGEAKSTQSSPKTQWLAVDPAAAARDAMGAQHWPGLNLAELLAGLFNWLGSGIELKALLDALAVLLAINDEPVATSEAQRSEFVESAPTPVEALKWQEYLRWLWQALASLSLPQRTAFLLHSDVAVEFDFRGVASVRQIAARLEIPAEEFAVLWNRIPLDELTIAARIGRERQQVINLRRVARDRLGAAWHEWIGGGAS